MASLKFRIFFQAGPMEDGIAPMEASERLNTFQVKHCLLLELWICIENMQPKVYCALQLYVSWLTACIKVLLRILCLL